MNRLGEMAGDGGGGGGDGESRKGGSPFTQGTHTEPNAPKRTQATCSGTVWHRAKFTTCHRIYVLQCGRDTTQCL